MEKSQYYIDVCGEVLPTPRGTVTAVATSSSILNNLEKRIPQKLQVTSHKS